MNPTAMLTLLVSLFALFVWTANRRWGLLRIGHPVARTDRIGARLGAVVRFALLQKKMRYYPLAGLAHMAIFAGFVILLLRSVLLWGRGFDAGWSGWIFGPDPAFGLPLGHVYDFAKDVVATLVIAGVCVFAYYRVIRPQRRMTLHFEGLLILGIIFTMMVADMAYDGASLVLHRAVLPGACAAPAPDLVDACEGARTVAAHFGAAAAPDAKVAWNAWPSPAGSLFAVALAAMGLGPKALVAVAHAGFWTHSALVLIFLNILPYSKHFHILTAIPNVFFSEIGPAGRLPPIAESSEKLMETVGAAAEKEDPLADRVGYARLPHLTWKDVLDLYTCTECGRCSDNCPANRTGKLLSPKHLTLDLRDHLYGREEEVLEAQEAAEKAGGGAAPAIRPVDLVPNVIHPDVLWACTTCRACEEQCPVLISYVDKIVQMRRSLVLVRGEFPNELGKPFQGMETNGNPWNLARVDRAAWAEGLDVPTMADKPDAEVLYWVGCAASYDDRAKKVARAFVRLLRAGRVNFAILGQEETCTGDPARRAGNEYLYLTLAEQNVATIEGYRKKGGAKRIVTACPHCFSTLRNEYPDLGGRWDVVPHVALLLELVQSGKIVPKRRVAEKVVYHDSCYLGRYNGVYDAPREILRRVAGVELVEAAMSRHKGLCCGAGGAQMWMEEQNKERMNVARTRDLIGTGARTIASACPFCMTMLTDGLKAESKEDDVRQRDVAEVLLEACGLGEGDGPEEKGETAAGDAPAA